MKKKVLMVLTLCMMTCIGDTVINTSLAAGSPPDYIITLPARYCNVRKVAICGEPGSYQCKVDIRQIECY
ncbi:hypothetical protein [Thermonema sp.]|uniref:hypothetical protein n=1 Tax=Thermonema sp. TaxID=2231181 RepID=UPI002584A252|nr:hypothetical protein [Thermonema sp.]